MDTLIGSTKLIIFEEEKQTRLFFMQLIEIETELIFLILILKKHRMMMNFFVLAYILIGSKYFFQY